MGIILGVNATYPGKGVGNVTPQLNEGNTIHLQEVLYVPDLKKNLVSISAREDIHQWKGTCVDKEFLKDAFEFRVGNLYQVSGSPLGTMSVDTSLL